MTPPRVIVTRPAQEAERWVRDLRARGIVADALPLIAILPVADAGARAALQQARAQLGGYQAAMFVSGNAARYFLGADSCPSAFKTEEPVRAELVEAGAQGFDKLSPNGGDEGKWASGGALLASIETRAWATGPGTARALAQGGWPPDRIDVPEAGALADSEALWARVQARVQPGARVLIVRGGDAHGNAAGRAWLADQLAAAGARVQTVVAYRRSPPAWDAAQQALARAAAQDGSVWLMSSSEAAANLGALMPGLALQTARAVATHPRVAQAARAAGFGAVIESAPTLDAVIRSIESFT